MTQARSSNAKTRKYRVLAGQVVMNDPTIPKDNISRYARGKTFGPGDVVESTIDLSRRYGNNKFQLLPEDDLPESVPDLERRYQEIKQKLDTLRSNAAIIAAQPPVEDPVPQTPAPAQKPVPVVQPAHTDASSWDAQQADNAASQKASNSLSVQGSDLDTYDAMTLDELKKFAAGEEIELGNAKTKPEIIAHIREALEIQRG
jgi:hypothetical protein